MFFKYILQHIYLHNKIILIIEMRKFKDRRKSTVNKDQKLIFLENLRLHTAVYYTLSHSGYKVL